MKLTIHLTRIALFVLSITSQAPAQITNFNSGSDGSYGPLNNTSNTTLDLPTNGIFNCTTITVASGVTLTFNRNPLNTPVYLLATGDVAINGAVDVSGGSPNGRTPGAGGPGGFDGGWGGYGGTGFGGTGLGSDGQGPGGGRNAGCSFGGSFGTQGGNGTSTYGNSLLIPLIGGSGGAGSNGNPGGGGAGGGGAILIASSTRIVVNGAIYSVGGGSAGYYSTIPGGSGGAVRLVAPVVTGTGTLSVPGTGGGFYCTSSGSGRTRIDCIDGYAVRTLHANGPSSRGAQMFVFPALQPRLDIIQAAGQAIPIGAGSLVSVLLPQGATNAQTVVVQATNFTNDLPITVAVIPTDRPSTTYPALISLTNNPPTVTVPVNLAVDATNRIMVWANY